MKTAVSIPDDVYAKAERLARRTRKSRSEIYSAALREYTARHAPDEVTEAFDRLSDELTEPLDPMVRAAGRRTLKRSVW